MNPNEMPKLNYDDPKAFYTLFGFAFYKVQVLEQAIVDLAVVLNAKGLGTVTIGDILGLYEDFDGNTFGKVLHVTQALTTFSPSLETDLKQALRYRHYLAHSFFVDHFEDAVIQEGRKEMIDELQSIVEFLVKVKTQFDSVCESMWPDLSITPEGLDHKFAEIQQARDEEETS
jgi:hypothetical protein